MNTTNRNRFYLIALLMVVLFSQPVVSSANEKWIELRDATRNGDLSAINQFLDEGVDINFQDNAGWTILHWWNFSLDFSYRNFVKTLRLLIKRGVDVNAGDIRGRTALMLLLVPGDDQPQTPQLEAIQILIDAGTDIARKNKSGESALSLGLSSKFPEVKTYFENLEKTKPPE